MTRKETSHLLDEFGIYAVALILGICFGVSPAHAEGPAKKSAKQIQATLPLDQLKSRVKHLESFLGDEAFHKRRKANLTLINIGHGIYSSKADKKATLTFVLERMKALRKHHDPEVAMRARNVIKRLTPQPEKQLKRRPPVTESW